MGLSLALLGGGFVLLLGWRASGGVMPPAEAQIDWSLESYPELAPEPVAVSSRTGITLAGRFFPGRNGATIILTHGYGGNQDETLPVVATLAAAGFSVFTYDLRGCGQSGGAVTLGALEQDDLRSVIDAVASRPDVDPERLGALGFSMGAAATVLAVAEDPRIKAVVDDSGWADVMHWLRPRLGDLIRHPRTPFTPLSLRLVELRTGIRLRRLRPVDAIGRLAPRLLLIIHGELDESCHRGTAT